MTAAMLARMAASGMDPAAIDAALPPDAHGLRALLAEHRPALATMAGLSPHMARAHEPGADVRAAFEAIAAVAPEMGCAAYALGDPGLLAQATEEVLRWLRAQRLVRGDVVDIGCGTGRFARALADLGCVVDAYDTSPGMLAAAAAHTGVRYHMSAGVVAPPPCDLALFADSMPYLVLAGIAEAQVAAVARALRPGGAMVVLNLSYRDDSRADAADARRWCDAHGWEVARAEPFVGWDAAAFVFTASRATNTARGPRTHTPRAT